MARRVVVDLRSPEVLVVVFWSVELALRVNEGVDQGAYSVDVEVGEA